MMKEGLYDLSLDMKSLRNYNLMAVQAAPSRKSHIPRLNQLFETIQADKTINPNGIPFLRGKSYEGLPGAPWLWNPEHMFDDYN